MGLLGTIFGTKKAMETGVDMIDRSVTGIISGLDAAFYTKEEKAVDFLKITDRRMTMVEKLQDQFAPRAITRRILALIIVGSTFLHLNLYALLILWGTFWPRYIEVTPGEPKVNALQWGMTQMSSLLVQEIKITLLVCFFYFGYYGVKSGIEAWKNKKG